MIKLTQEQLGQIEFETVAQLVEFLDESTKQQPTQQPEQPQKRKYKKHRRHRHKKYTRDYRRIRARWIGKRMGEIMRTNKRLTRVEAAHIASTDYNNKNAVLGKRKIL